MSVVRNLSFALVLLAPLLPAQDGRATRRTPVVRAIERVSPAVVSIRTQARMRRAPRLNGFFQFHDEDGGSLQDASLGSGVIIESRGYVVTNEHVVQQADRVQVGLTDGRVLEARVVGADSKNDIAVLKVVGEGPFPTARLGRDDDLMIGEPTLALGNPFGLDGSVTEGILSQTNRTVHFRGKPVFKDFLQTSAVINPGNSGGPLINILGEVIGVNVAIHSRGPGIGFAIPVSRVRDVIYNVLDPRLTRRAWLGAEIDHASEAAGALIAEIEPESPAERAGLLKGDLILAVGDRTMTSWIDFQTTIGELPIGHAVPVRVSRGGGTAVREIQLEPSPATPAERAVFAAVGFEFGNVAASLRERRPDLNGIHVERLKEGSGADQVGLQEGDIIIEMGNIRDLDRDKAMQIISAYSRRRRDVPIYLYRPADDAYYGGELPIAR